MPRRRLSERQLERIRAIQDRRRQRLEDRRAAVAPEPDDEDPRHGLVVVRHGANLAVEDDAGLLHHCVTRRNIGHPVCGDRVIWQPAGDGTGVVTALQPRDNALSRPDFSGRDKPLAANLSLFAVVIAPKPPPSGYLVDQYLVAAELIGVRALLVAGKMDLLDDDERSRFLADLAHYRNIGYPVCPVSTKGEPGLASLSEHLSGETAILLGQSGVGKSSLVNRLLPDQDIQIGRLSKATGLGRHTTSAATCYRLPGDGRLIDSPGVRSFRLVGLSQAELEQGFRDLSPVLGRCRFRDCRHLNEPDCAVRQAVDSGAIDARRVENFQHLRESLVARNSG